LTGGLTWYGNDYKLAADFAQGKVKACMMEYMLVLHMNKFQFSIATTTVRASPAVDPI